VIHFGAFPRGKPCIGMPRAKSSAKVESLLGAKRRGAWKCNTPTTIS